MTNPKQSKTLHVETLGEELSVYDWQRQQMHSLNDTAAKVFALCDGKHSSAQMAILLALPEDMVLHALGELNKVHLLEVNTHEESWFQQSMSRRAFLKLGGAVAAAAIVSIVVPHPVAAQSAPPTGSQTFDYTGAVQTFTVPAGVNLVYIDAYGAQGGKSETMNLAEGGKGGRIFTSISVTPGETLDVYVGGQGQDAVTDGGGTLGGWNGGGGGGGESGGGGGASDVRRGATKLVVAGGGGGAGHANLNTIANGGVGGGATGGAGTNGTGVVTGGGGGTQSGGGAGGTGIFANGTGGSSGTGGTGSDNTSTPPQFGGGGGGGGYYGGGGGGGGGQNPSRTIDDGAGGGGGSSYPASGTHTQGERMGDGAISIGW